MDHSLATTCSRIFIYFCHTVLSKQATLPFFPYFFNLKNVFNFYSVVSVSAMCACVLSHVQLSVTPGTVAHQAASFMGFSRLEYWSGLPFPLSGDPPNPGIKPGSLTLQANSLPTKLQGKSQTGMGAPKTSIQQTLSTPSVMAEELGECKKQPSATSPTP